MSSLRPMERSKFERLFGMGSGYVLNFSDSTFGGFFAEVAGVDIHSDTYCKYGSSKAKKLRAFWDKGDDATVAKVLAGLIEVWETTSDSDPENERLSRECWEIVGRLRAGGSQLGSLRTAAVALDAHQLSIQIKRMEESILSDPALAIGTAKELIETVCKTILAERGKPVSGTPDIPSLTKETLKELKLVPDSVPESSRGSDIIRRVLQNLGAIGNGLAELRGLYGTGHGKDGKAKGLGSRHAKLAVGAATTLAIFLFETHVGSKS